MKFILWFRMVGYSIRAPFTGPFGVRRALLLLLFTPLFVLLQTVHWVGLALDELFYPGYRETEFREPLFILGFPRSGTTFLHTTLAADPERFVTAPLWELVLTPSIVERRVAAALSRLDRWVGRPIGRLLGVLERRLASELEEINPVGLTEPGEDQLLLLPAFACFLLVAVFPRDPELWALTRFDEWPERRRRAVIEHYRGLVRRHLFAHGAGDRRYLSKNPSFTPLMGSLLRAFPEARVVFCYRDPRQAIPSQLSSLRPAARVFGWDPAAPEVRERFVEMYAHFATYGADALRDAGNRAAVVSLLELSDDPAGVVLDLYRRFGWRADETYRDALRVRSERSRAYRSTHTYDAAEFDLSPTDLGDRFERARSHFTAAASGAES